MRFIVMADTHFITPELTQRERNEPGGEIWWNRVLWLRKNAHLWCLPTGIYVDE